MDFTYDHLHATNDVEKVKSLGSQKKFKLLKTYLMRSVVFGWALFEYYGVSAKK